MISNTKGRRLEYFYEISNVAQSVKKQTIGQSEKRATNMTVSSRITETEKRKPTEGNGSPGNGQLKRSAAGQLTRSRSLADRGILNTFSLRRLMTLTNKTEMTDKVFLRADLITLSAQAQFNHSVVSALTRPATALLCPSVQEILTRAGEKKQIPIIK